MGERSLDELKKRMKKIIPTAAKSKATIGLESSPTKINGNMKKNPDPEGAEDNVINSTPMNTRNIPAMISRSGACNSQSLPDSNE